MSDVDKGKKTMGVGPTDDPVATLLRSVGPRTPVPQETMEASCFVVLIQALIERSAAPVMPL